MFLIALVATGCGGPAPPPLDTSIPDASGPPRPVLGSRDTMEQPGRDPALRSALDE
jgi:hypothetical protein